MLKTGMEVEADIYRLVKDSELAAAIRGNVYRWGTRPNDAKTEDIVVHYMSGTAEQLQFGIVLVNIYVPNVAATGGGSMPDLARIGKLQSLIYPMLWDDKSDYSFTLDELPTFEEVNGLAQQCITARLRFARMAV